MRTFVELEAEACKKSNNQADQLKVIFEKYVERGIIDLLVDEPNADKIFFFIDDFEDFIRYAKSVNCGISITKTTVLKMLEKVAVMKNGMRCWFTSDKLNNIFVDSLMPEQIGNFYSIKIQVAFKDVEHAKNLIAGHNRLMWNCLGINI